jgi:hypothetical protein
MQTIATVGAIVLCVGLRLVPALVLAVPYLPDPWVHIAKANSILQWGHFDIWGDYADHWPGLNVLIALLSGFLGVDTITVGQFLIPLLCSLSLVFFYLLIRRLTGNGLIALTGLLLMGFASPLTLIMGTTYKEGLARLFLSAALFALSIRSSNRFARVSPVILCVGAIIPTHHLTFLVAGTALLFAVISTQIFSLRSGELTRWSWLFQTLSYFSVFAFALLYYIIFNCAGLLPIDTTSLAVGLFAYVVLFGALNLRRLLATSTTSDLKLVLGGLMIVAVVALVGSLILRPIFPLTVLPASTLLLLAPLLATITLAWMGLASIDRLSIQVKILFSSWMFALFAISFYAFFSGHSSINLILTYRLFIFSLAPLSALAGIGVFAYAASHPRRTRVVQAGLIIGLLAVLPVSTLAFNNDPFFGYGCSVTPPIQTSNEWLATHAPTDAVVVGDHLFTYYMEYYLERSTDVGRGIQLFVGGDRATAFTFAGVHQYMEDNGFWLPSGVQWTPLDLDIVDWLATHTSICLVFNNGEVQLYRRNPSS